MTILSINKLTKEYKNLTAVNQLNLEVKKGEIYGILGPNGSGKTTTLGMILGVIKPTEGSFKWFDTDNLSKNRHRIGAILETPNFYPYLNAADNLDIISHIKKCSSENNKAIIDLVGLSDFPKLTFKKFSLGMKQRLAIAGALVGDPDVLIFDEPTNGLDPQGIAEVRKLLIEIGARGKTILLASHIIDEVEKICTHAAIIKKGNLVVSGCVKDIINQKPYIELKANDMQKLEHALKSLDIVHKINIEGAFIHAEINSSPELLNELLSKKGVFLNHLVIKNKSLEAEFLDRIK